MSTELTRLVEELNKNLTDERKINDERYDALEKGNTARAEELKSQLDGVEEAIAASQKKVKEEERKGGRRRRTQNRASGTRLFGERWLPCHRRLRWQGHT